MNQERPFTRRAFLDYALRLGSFITAVAMVVPALRYLWPAARGGGAENVEVSGADALAEGQSQTVRLGGQAVIVIRRRDGFKAFSAACTHLGCLVKWDPARREFLCPCHAAVFDEAGRVVSGPPPSPLTEVPVRKRGGKVFVST